MTKTAIISNISKSFRLKRQDAEVLYKVASSPLQCEIDFPEDVTEWDRANYLSAYEKTVSLIEESEKHITQLTEMAPEQPHTSILEVIAEVQKGAGDALKVEELGLRWGRSDLSKDEMMEFICRLYASFVKTRRIQAFLGWAIADACNMSHKLYGNLPEIVDRVSAMFGIGKYVLMRMCKVAKIVPVYTRTLGWNYQQYEVLIRYAPAIGKDRFYSTAKTLAKGREIELKLTCGATVKSHSPLTKDQVEEVILSQLKIKRKKRRRANTRGYLYLTPIGPLHSLQLDARALSSPSVQVVDLSSLEVLKRGKPPISIPGYDRHAMSSFLNS